MICFEIYFLQIISDICIFVSDPYRCTCSIETTYEGMINDYILHYCVLNYLTFGYFEEIEEQISVSGFEFTQNVFGNEFFLPRVKDSLPRLNWKSRDSARTIFPQFCREDITGKIVLDEIE